MIRRTRDIRLDPPPTAKQLRAVLDQYGMYRHRAAAIMCIAEVTFNRYMLAPTSKHHLRIPAIRWERLLRTLKDLTGAEVEVPE